tara:strand:- start:1044 stop:1874 length:831 start_codon:yes stop_codon:yes gene_type:complete
VKKKFKKIAGLTLIEILIAVVISSLMMAAMFTSYTIVNNTYRQVTDRAKLSQAGRDLIGQLLREIRMAGYRYVNDDMAPDNDHVAIKITKGSGLEGGTCDKLQIVYGSVDYTSTAAEGERYEYTRYQITYECEKSTQVETLADGSKQTIDGFKILKSKKKWDVATNTFETGTDDTLYEEEMVLDYVQDLIFVPFDANGKQIGNQDPGNVVPGLANIESLRTVDIALIVRSTKPFYRENKNREVTSIYDSDRKIDHKTDKYLREIITVTANARNAGL